MRLRVSLCTCLYVMLVCARVCMLSHVSYHMLVCACVCMLVCACVCMLLHGSLCMCLYVITWKFVHVFVPRIIASRNPSFNFLNTVL